MKNRERWVGGRACLRVAMAWVESAVVFYLRTMIDRLEPYQPNPLPVDRRARAGGIGARSGHAGHAVTVGMLAGRTWRSRLGYTAWRSASGTFSIMSF